MGLFNFIIVNIIIIVVSKFFQEEEVTCTHTWSQGTRMM
jgi:hypothetical protein